MTTTPVTDVAPAPAIAIPVFLDSRWSIDAMFGGALGVTLVDAAVQATAAAETRVLSSLAISFVRPASPGSATVLATIVHAGRGSSVVSCSLVTDAGLAATAIVTLVPPARLPLEAAPASAPPLPPAASLLEGALTAVSHRVDWRTASAWGTGEMDAWIRPREDWPAVDGGVDPSWAVVAADLLGPALPGAGVDSPFRIATTVLDVQVIARTASPWLRQSVRAEAAGRSAVATLELHSPGGTRVAIATQRAVLLPASVNDLPFAVTGFGWGGPVPVPQEKRSV